MLWYTAKHTLKLGHEVTALWLDYNWRNLLFVPFPRNFPVHFNFTDEQHGQRGLATDHAFCGVFWIFLTMEDPALDFPDNLKLFVGNIPYTTHKYEVDGLFQVCILHLVTARLSLCESSVKEGGIAWSHQIIFEKKGISEVLLHHVDHQNILSCSTTEPFCQSTLDAIEKRNAIWATQLWWCRLLRRCTERTKEDVRGWWLMAGF